MLTERSVQERLKTCRKPTQENAKTKKPRGVRGYFGKKYFIIKYLDYMAEQSRFEPPVELESHLRSMALSTGIFNFYLFKTITYEFC